MELECDIQGVLRGRCTRCGNCNYYRTPPPPSVFCAACHHPPGLHQNMGRRPPQQQLPSVAGAQPSSKGLAQTALSNAGTGYAPSGSGYPSTIQARQPSLKTCISSGPFVSSSTLTASGASDTQQDRSHVMSNLAKVPVEKGHGNDVGIVVSKSLSFSPVADRPAFLITGVVTGGPAYTLFKEGKLKLFGLITHVNSKDTKDLDESFNDFTRRLDTVELHVDMSNATTPFPSDPCTHVIGIKYRSATEDIGIDFQDSPNGVVVEKVNSGKVPDLSGVCSRDIILPRPGSRMNASSLMAYLVHCQGTGEAMVLCIKGK